MQLQSLQDDFIPQNDGVRYRNTHVTYVAWSKLGSVDFFEGRILQEKNEIK